MSIRDDFESHFAGEYGMAKDELNQYVNADTAAAWNGWQASGQGAEPVAWCFTDVNGKPSEFCDHPKHASDGDLRVRTPLHTQPQSAGSVPEALRSALTAAIGVAHDRKGDVSDEDGSYATTPVDNMIELETALCEFFDTGSDDVIAHKMLPKMEALLTTTPQPAKHPDDAGVQELESANLRDAERYIERLQERIAELEELEGCDCLTPQPAATTTITPAMIEAGAKRLVRPRARVFRRKARPGRRPESD